MNRTPCRVYPVRDCEGRAANMFTTCKKCPGPVDLNPTTNTRPEPVPVEAMKEEKTMPDPTPKITGTCDRCGRVKRLGKTRHQEGSYCDGCAVTIGKAHRLGKPVPPFTGITGPKGDGLTKPTATPSAKKPASATKVSHGRQIAKQRPAADVEGSLKKIGADLGSAAVEAILAGGGSRPGLTLRFAVTLPRGATTLELMDVLRALPAGAVLEG